MLARHTKWVKKFSRYGARWALGLLLTVLALLEVNGTLQSDAIERFDNFLVGTRMRLTPAQHDPRIVIVDIDEKSLARVGRFPWSRDVVARLVGQLTTHYEVNVVGFDVAFPEPDTSSGYGVLARLAEHELKNVPGFRNSLAALANTLDYDGLLAAALEGQPVVLGYPTTEDQQKGMLPAPAFTVDDLNGRSLDALAAKGYSANIERLQSAAAGAGFYSAVVDTDGIMRSAPLLMRIGNGYYPSLGLATAAVALDAKAIKPVLETNVSRMSERARANGGIDEIAIYYGKRRGTKIKVGENLKVMIEYRGVGGPRGGAFTYVSASDVLDGKVSKAVLEGTIVLVGTTAPGINDLRSTPVNSEYPGVEAHANVIKSILDKSFKYRPDYAFAVELLQTSVIGLLLAVLLVLATPWYSIALTLGAAVLVLGVNYWMYIQNDWVINLAVLLLLIVGLFVANLAWGYLFEVRKARALVSRFGEYVAPELVSEMADDPEKYTMEGESRDLTVLFVDVRGFTTISEGLTPKALREYIDLYLTAMSEDIRDSYHGTLDKYIGDAVMAFWGAPVHFADHARRGVATSLLMQASAERLNQDFIARGLPELKIGIGLNTGTMHVGDMGSKIRRAYTVMGDAVNLGSRLEGITKVYGVGIVVGPATRAGAPEFVYRELDLVRVKGKHEPVAIFEPVGLLEQVDAAEHDAIRRWHDALTLVRAQQWDAADAALVELQQRDPERGLYRMYRERIAHYRIDPPGQLWDGVTKFDTK